MYIKYNNTEYSCDCTINKNSIKYSGLTEDFPSPADGEIVLCSNDGFIMRTDNTSDYLRQEFVDGVLTLTNLPESTIVENEETTEPSAQDDTDAMLVDHEYRITLLELGVTE